MNTPCRRILSLLSVTSCLLANCVLTGCVERRFVITTDPPGAIVIDENGNATGSAPVDRQWTYNGTYQFTLIKDGFQTQVVREHVAARWYEYVPFDFIAENVIPWTIRDIRRFHYQLQPMQWCRRKPCSSRGKALRARGQTIGTPTVAMPIIEAPSVGTPTGEGP